MNPFKRLFMFLSLLTGLLIPLFFSYGSSATPLVSASGPIDPLQIVLDHLDQNRTQYGLVEADLSDYVVTDMYQTRDTGVTHIYLRQRINGLDIWGANLNANIMPDGSILTLNNAFVPQLDRALYSGQPTLTAAEALNSAAEQLRWPITSYFVAEQSFGGVDQQQILSTAGVAVDPVPARLIYYLGQDGHLSLAWEALVEPINGSDYWQMAIDAHTGRVLEKFNWTVSHNQADIALGQDRILSVGDTPTLVQSPNSVPDGSSYQVYPIPVESPNHIAPFPPADGRTIVNEPADATASPFGWHDTDGVAGAEFTTTQGNNVHAYTDTDDNDIPDPGSSPDGGAGLDFIFAIDLTQAPSTYAPASVTNLFYWNNVTHDILYLHGFNEASGNFQVNNYGRGGLGNDDVQAEAQDGGGTNNANFFTPADGQRPRMQMYIGVNPTPDQDGSLDAGVIVHEYAHGWSIRLTGGPATVNCLTGTEQMGEGWSDFLGIAFTARVSDTSTTSRPIGTYLFGQPANGPGIRAFPYNTDMTVDPRTYSDTVPLTAVHAVGSIWAAMLWEVYWDLVDEYGFNPNLYQDYTTGGNNLALRLVSDGLKMQPCTPGFVDGRDAILAADQALTGGANQCLIWEGFAKRGLGFSASQGSSAINTDNVEAFDLPDICTGMSSVPMSQNICQGSPAAYTLTAGTDFVGNVNLSAVGNPAPSTVNFSVNPITVIPGSSDMTIDNTDAVAGGSYTITVLGDDGTVTDTVDVTLNVAAGVPSVSTLVSPANGATDVSLNPTLNWDATADTNEYLVEIATDADFANVVYTATVATNTHEANADLVGSTPYFWRVTSLNGCGAGNASAISYFVTIGTFCRQPNMAIGAASVFDTFVVANVGEILDLNVSVDASHTWVGDLTVTLTHQETATSVTMIDQPGAPPGDGCSANDVNVLLDDEGVDGPVENQCSGTPPALFGNPTPNNSLSAFDGEGLSGTWILTVEDAFTALDSGTLHEWCLVPTLDLSDYGVEVNSTPTAQNGDADTSVSYTVDITNTGSVADSYTISVFSSEGWLVTADSPMITLNPNETGVVEVTVELPANAAGGTVDTTTLIAFSQANGGINDSVDLATTVNHPEIEVNPTALEVTVIEGQTADQTLTISNNGGSNLEWKFFNTTPLVALTGELQIMVSAPSALLAETELALSHASAEATESFVPHSPQAVLYDQTDSPGTNGFPSQNFEPANDSFDNMGADDFVIPVDELWVIETIDIIGSRSNGAAPPIPLVDVTIYMDNAGLPGTAVYSAVGLVPNEVASGDFEITLINPATLSTGHYWLSVVANASAATYGQWFWSTRAIQSNNPYAWQNPGGGFSTPCTTWGAGAATCGVGGGVEPDTLFRINGTLVAGCDDVSAVSWLSVAPASGTTTVGNADDVTVAYDATGYASGIYTATLCILSNDPLNSVVTVPVTMTIIDAIHSFDWSADTIAQEDTAGQTVTYTISVTNTGNITDTYSIGLAGHSWATTASHVILTLAPNESADFTVTVTIAAGATPPDTDTTTVTVTSDADNSVTAAVDLTTTVIQTNYGIYLPMIMKP